MKLNKRRKALGADLMAELAETFPSAGLWVQNRANDQGRFEIDAESGSG